jgi:hypothetical protein
VSRSKRTFVRLNIAGLGIVFAAVVALVASAPVESQRKRVAAGTVSDGSGDNTTNGGPRSSSGSCNSTGAQQWLWRNQNRLVNPQSGRCLDVTGGRAADATRLQIWDCNSTAAQAWYLPKRRWCTKPFLPV